MLYLDKSGLFHCREWLHLECNQAMLLSGQEARSLTLDEEIIKIVGRGVIYVLMNQ